MPPHTRAFPVAEELLRASGQVLEGSADHTLGPEGVWVREEGWVAVDAVEDDNEGLFRGDGVFPPCQSDGCLVAGEGLDVEARRCGGETGVLQTIPAQ